MERLYSYYPKCKGKIKQVHIGTPLTNMYYLNSPQVCCVPCVLCVLSRFKCAACQGASYGLDWTVERFEAETMEVCAVCCVLCAVCCVLCCVCCV